MPSYQDIITECIQLRRRIHQYPEIGADVYQTVALIEENLSQTGLIVHKNIGKNGLYADLIVHPDFPMIGFRADMDALPIQEINEHDWKSTRPGIAHLCGHDAHTAMLLSAAKWLDKQRSQLQRNIRFIFQPDEENLPGGALPMIEDGVLDGLDAIFGMHVWPSLTVGQLGICSGPAMAQPDTFEIEIIGRGGHAAYPEKCIDPILLASQLIQNCQSLISRNISALEKAVLSFTKIDAGTTHNVIPRNVQLMGTIRTLDKKTKEKLRKLLVKQLESLCLLQGATYTLKYTDGHAITINDASLAQKIAEQATDLEIIFPHIPSMAGEDFGYYSQIIPACFVFLGCSHPKQMPAAMLHNPYFDLDERCLEKGINYWLTLAKNL